MSAFGAIFTGGKVQSGEYEVIATPHKAPAVAQRPIIFAHGYTAAGGEAGAAASYSMSQGNYGEIFRALASLGSVVISADFANNAFGNNTAAARVEAYRQLAIGLGARNDKAVVVGMSMGFMTGYGYQRQNPGKLAGLFGICPASSLQDIMTNARVPIGDVQTALGLGSSTTAPAQYDPTQTPGILAGIPGQLFYGTADQTIIPATVTTLAGKLGWTATVIDTANSHLSDAQLGGLNRATLTGLVSPLL